MFRCNSRISKKLKTMRVPYRKCTLHDTDKALPVIRRRVVSRSSDIKVYCCAPWDARCAWEEHVNVEDKESANKQQLFSGATKKKCFADNCGHSRARFSHALMHISLTSTHTAVYTLAYNSLESNKHACVPMKSQQVGL